MDNYPEPCMCGATDCRICGPLQGYRVRSRNLPWDREDDEFEDEDQEEQDSET